MQGRARDGMNGDGSRRGVQALWLAALALVLQGSTCTFVSSTQNDDKNDGQDQGGTRTETFVALPDPLGRPAVRLLFPLGIDAGRATR